MALRKIVKASLLNIRNWTTARPNWVNIISGLN